MKLCCYFVNVTTLLLDSDAHIWALYLCILFYIEEMFGVRTLHVIVFILANQIKSNQIKSNHFYCHIIKCLGEWNSYERAPDSAKKTTNNLHMDRQCKKNCTGAFTVLQTVQKKKKTIYIWTVHIYRLYRRQCAKYTYIYSVHIVYYKDTLNYQRHIIHRMGTSTLCTVSIHNVVYT